MRDTTSSGAEVPNDTIVSPMTKAGTPNLNAKLVAPSTK